MSDEDTAEGDQPMTTPATPQATERPQLVAVVSPWGRKSRRSLMADEIAELERLGWVIKDLPGLSR